MAMRMMSQASCHIRLGEGLTIDKLSVCRPPNITPNHIVRGKGDFKEIDLNLYRIVPPIIRGESSIMGTADHRSTRRIHRIILRIATLMNCGEVREREVPTSITKAYANLPAPLDLLPRSPSYHLVILGGLGTKTSFCLRVRRYSRISHCHCLKSRGNHEFHGRLRSREIILNDNEEERGDKIMPKMYLTKVLKGARVSGRKEERGTNHDLLGCNTSKQVRVSILFYFDICSVLANYNRVCYI